MYTFKVTFADNRTIAYEGEFYWELLSLNTYMKRHGVIKKVYRIRNEK